MTKITAIYEEVLFVYKNFIMIGIKFRSLSGFYESKIDRFDIFIYCQFLISFRLQLE